MNKLTFFVNNNRTMEISQDKLDEDVILRTLHSYEGYDAKVVIPPGDMVMLMNLYRYVKENDILHNLLIRMGEMDLKSDNVYVII